MSWVDLVVGAGITATAYSSGAGLGFSRGRKVEKQKAAKDPKLICSCEHGYGSHLAGGVCEAEIKRPNKWGTMKGYSGSDHEIGWEYVPCPCRTYDGPEPPIDILNWAPPSPAMPPKEEAS